MADTATHTFRPKDKVVIDPNAIGVSPSLLGRVFVVEKVNPKNVIARPAEGGRGINYPKDCLLPAPAEGAAVVGVPYTTFVFHDTGTIVTCDSDLGTWKKGTPLVVFKCDGSKSNVTPLGGADGRYYRVPVARLVVRDTAWLAEYLVNAL